MGTTEFGKLDRGVTIRQDRGRSPKYRISFTYKGVRCRETLSLSVSTRNTRYVNRLLGEINNKIERGTFNYADQFPKSKNLQKFGLTSEQATVRYYLDHYIELAERRGLALSTVNGYKKDRTTLKEFHDLKVVDIQPSHIKNWITKQTVSKKSIGNRLSILRSSLNEAVIDGIVPVNPLEKIRFSQYLDDDRNAGRDDVDPFTPEEVAAIIEHSSDEQIANIFEFAFETGLRSSELIATRWQDVSWPNKTYRVQVALVSGELKKPKTTGGIRDIDLSERALEILKRQMHFTDGYDQVFHNPRTMNYWETADQLRKTAWVPTLKRAGVRYRKAYNTRHTFATKHISQKANIWWLARQMGHRSPMMLFRHYGGFLKEYDDEYSGR